MQSTLRSGATPAHVAIVMDGNGRWATTRGRPRAAGHLAGARAVRPVVEAAREQGVATLTLYAFSGDNWSRPATEVASLMRIFRRYLGSEAARCADAGIRLRVIGRRDRLDAALLEAVERAEAVTESVAPSMTLRIAVDYSSRDAIVRAAAAADATDMTREAFAAALGRADNGGAPAPDVDLLVRTGGEQRLSDFLLWEAAYAELFFTPRMWPDFTAAEFVRILRSYGSRERRFGGLAASAAG